MGEKKNNSAEFNIDKLKTENNALNERIDTLYKYIVIMSADLQDAMKRIDKLEKPARGPKCACEILGIESCVIHSNKD